MACIFLYFLTDTLHFLMALVHPLHTPVALDDIVMEEFASGVQFIQLLVDACVDMIQLGVDVVVAHREQVHCGPD